MTTKEARAVKAALARPTVVLDDREQAQLRQRLDELSREPQALAEALADSLVQRALANPTDLAVLDIAQDPRSSEALRQLCLALWGHARAQTLGHLRDDSVAI
jgi:hypothetical protein